MKRCENRFGGDVARRGDDLSSMATLADLEARASAIMFPIWRSV